MAQPVPEFGALVTSALRLAGRDVSIVDIAAMTRRAHVGVEAVLKELCSKLHSLNWEDIQIVLNRHDFSPALLSDYLSTCGAAGVAANDKLAQLMTGQIPELLADEVGKGSFDLNSADPAHLVRVISGLGSTPAAADAAVILPDPGLPEDDPKQLGYQALKACGLTILSFGNLSLEKHTQLLLETSPRISQHGGEPRVRGLSSRA